ncbi:MAG: PilN domain-containing protein [Deltaproteobacteria bacterium]|nr:PilN domain-containing protein [Deltaproteobacteria bacterium]
MSRILGVAVKPSDLVKGSGFRLKNHMKRAWLPSKMDNAMALAHMEIMGGDAFNFQKARFDAKQYWIEHGKPILQAGIIAGLVMMLALFNIFFETHALQKQVNQIDQQTTDLFRSTFPDVKRVVDPLHQMREKMKAFEATAMFPELFVKKPLVIDVLNHISRQIPKTTDVEFTQLVINPETLLISGTTDTFNTVDDVKNRLKKVSVFEKVTISSANVDRAENRVRFKIKVDLIKADR